MMDISQMDLVAGILKLIDRLGCKAAPPRIINACISAANDIIREIERPEIKASDGMGLSAWLKSDDTGMSSKFMARVLAGGPGCEEAYPVDPDDFGRCYRFLRAVPSARPNLHSMRGFGPVWSAYADKWDEMEALYERELPTGKAPELYAMMKQIQDAARQHAGEGEK